MTSAAFLPTQPLPLRRTPSLQHRQQRLPTAVLGSRPKTSKRVWTPGSWRDRIAKQQPIYPDAAELADVERKLNSAPALVGTDELRSLREQLAAACDGHAFVLQGGDCAEDLNETADGIAGTLRALFKMAVVLMWGSREPVVKIGRLGGQYAKPRSSDMEIKDGIELPSYRGEIVNGSAFTPEERIPDPNRMMTAYFRSAGTTNLVRALASGGYADLKNVRRWGLDWSAPTDKGRHYMRTAERIAEALEFMDVCGLSESSPITTSTSVYTSHEGLLLPYEESLVSQDVETGEYYAGSGHFIWIGERTRGYEDAHIEFASGIMNPIGVKVGPTMTPEELLRLIDKLNPDNIPGRLTLITRMGADNIEKALPSLVRAVQREGRKVVWMSDSMHGNTFTSDSGYKTRSMDRIMKEVRGFFAVHEAEGTAAGGLHFEMTGKPVTECLGGMRELTSNDLAARYESLCDPRLNLDQSLEMAFEAAEILRSRRCARDGEICYPI